MSCVCCIVGTSEMLQWKMNQKSYRNCLFSCFSCRIWAVKSQKLQWFFSEYTLFSKQNRTVYWGGIAVNSRKRYFHIDENASTEQIYALLDVKSADEDDIDNLMNDSDTEFIVEEEITQAAYYKRHSIDYTRG